MKERPILFSSEMVRAILSGSKTVTRRVIKPQPPHERDFPGSSFGLSRAVADSVEFYTQDQYERLPKHPTDWELIGSVGVARDAGFPRVYRCPYGAVGDRLWVRETWVPTFHGRDCLYKADPGHDDPPFPFKGPWTPSIHMPRWASRITLEITEVRAERLQTITEGDVIREGCPMPILYGTGWFRELWDAINGKRAGCTWADSPWVWVVAFKRVEESR
jgi:hypothetical protein